MGIGVWGNILPQSQTWTNYVGKAGTGVSGDSSVLGGIGVWGTADSGYAVYGPNNGPYVTGLFLNNSSSSSYALEAGTLSKHCLIDTSGNLLCSGTVTGVVKGQGDRSVSLYAVQSPENWFEDFGSATLSNGSATVQLDPSFAATVNTGADYHVFPVPDGDCRGPLRRKKSYRGFRRPRTRRGNVERRIRVPHHRPPERLRERSTGGRNRDSTPQLTAENQQLARTNDRATRVQLERGIPPRPHLSGALGPMGTASPPISSTKPRL